MVKNEIIERITENAQQIKKKLIDFRRELYMHPELSGNEQRTATFVAGHLRNLGIDVQENIGGHGVIGILRGTQKSSRVVALRADMDALPFQDAIDKPYTSTVKGVKHACGHDVHTTVGLGVAEILASMREELSGTVKFIFQPAEESLEGATAMLKAGALENPRPNVIFGQHVIPIPVGTYGWSEFVLAGLERFNVNFSVRENSLDMSSLNRLVEQCCRGIETLNAGMIFPGSPEDLGKMFDDILAGLPQYINFTLYHARRFDEGDTARRMGFMFGYKTRPESSGQIALEKVKEVIDGILKPAGVQYEIEHIFSMPALINDTSLLRWSVPIMESVIGREKLVEVKGATPFSGEDFSYFAKEIPGAFFWLGAANLQKGINAIPHTPDFDVDEDCIGVGVRIMATMIFKYLQEK